MSEGMSRQEGWRPTIDEVAGFIESNIARPDLSKELKDGLLDLKKDLERLNTLPARWQGGLREQIIQNAVGISVRIPRPRIHLPQEGNK